MGPFMFCPYQYCFNQFWTWPMTYASCGMYSLLGLAKIWRNSPGYHVVPDPYTFHFAVEAWERQYMVGNGPFYYLWHCSDNSIWINGMPRSSRYRSSSGCLMDHPTYFGQSVYHALPLPVSIGSEIVSQSANADDGRNLPNLLAALDRSPLW